MAKNRKYQSAALRFGPALKAFVLCLLIGGSGIGYVWQKTQIYELGQQIRKREQQFYALKAQNEKLRTRLAEMHSQAFLETRIKELNLGLVQPSSSQTWRLQEAAVVPSEATRTPAVRTPPALAAR